MTRKAKTKRKGPQPGDGNIVAIADVDEGIRCPLELRNTSPEAQLLLTPYALPKPEPVSLEKCVAELVSELLTPSKKGAPCLLDQLYKYVELNGKTPAEEGDALTTYILGFEPTDLPRFTHNMCNFLGKILEKAVHIPYRMAYPDLYLPNGNHLKAQVEGLKSQLEENERIGKWNPDFLVALIASEIKYRAANGQGKSEQSWGARTLRRLGRIPRMLLFRASPNAKDYAAKGWLCSECDAMVALIKREAGIDLIELIRLVSLHPDVAAKIAAGRRRLFKREATNALYRFASYGDLIFAIAPDACIALHAQLGAVIAKAASKRPNVVPSAHALPTNSAR